MKDPLSSAPTRRINCGQSSVDNQQLLHIHHQLLLPQVVTTKSPLSLWLFYALLLSLVASVEYKLIQYLINMKPWVQMLIVSSLVRFLRCLTDVQLFNFKFAYKCFFQASSLSPQSRLKHSQHSQIRNHLRAKWLHPRLTLFYTHDK